ncbi:hypothetical protein Scep_008530 [Stephania cephalantha]|uniref:Uncharacterized protein n=1 Tax=Stephania cephalantha TaxID=152367 RepID=A0AAP0KBV0_9MAGN
MASLNSLCSLNTANVPSSNPPPISPSNKPPQIPWAGMSGTNNTKKDWNRQCFVGVVAACAILNLSSSDVGIAAGVVKWSERRACPPWQTNSLETIVPENLPRPFKRRISESIRLPFKTWSSGSAVIRPAVKANPDCFSM